MLGHHVNKKTYVPLLPELRCRCCLFLLREVPGLDRGEGGEPSLGDVVDMITTLVSLTLGEDLGRVTWLVTNITLVGEVLTGAADGECPRCALTTVCDAVVVLVFCGTG